MSTSTERDQLGFSFQEEEASAVQTLDLSRQRPARKKPDRQLLLFHPYEQAQLPIS
jgi:hypothetical protein